MQYAVTVHGGGGFGGGWRIAMNDLEFIRRLAAMKVLIVDDQRNMVKTIENMVASICAFRRKSESVLRAYDGKEALSLLLNQPRHLPRHIDLVLLDWNMPRTPGIEVVRGLRSSPDAHIKNVPVIMITGESKARDVNNALYEGVDNYLLKPFLLDDLRRRMNPLLRHYWAGLSMRRARNRRSEPRYFAGVLKMRVAVEFMDGVIADAEVITLSQHGLRVRMNVRETHAVSRLHFRGPDEAGGPARAMECVGFMPDGGAINGEIELSIWLKYGFHDPGDEAQWRGWVEASRLKELEYRNAFI